MKPLMWQRVSSEAEEEDFFRKGFPLKWHQSYAMVQNAFIDGDFLFVYCIPWSSYQARLD
jgi:hypothetical protein